MGILNVTPDSFSDGGEFDQVDRAIAQAQYLAAQGADIIDIGGQSTRPGSAPITLAEELERVIPVISTLRNQREPYGKIPISVDTTRAEVAAVAVDAGADLVNDVSGGTFDPEMLATVADLGVPMILMHLRGTPATMQQLTEYEDVVGEIVAFLQEQVQRALDEGIKRSHLIIDPGIGFGKTYAQNLTILQQIPRLKTLGLPVLIGPSRKSFIGHILQQPDPKQRIWGTAAACTAAIAHGADIIRVHDLPGMAEVARVADAIYRPDPNAQKQR